ncbi:CORVET complex WD repeat subunit Vps3 [Schizosaccharomyces pombe]|uniref:Vacuolar protein sorting-associated protein 3 n=1 Tax=Schizosaccharomyces pombe (strain 972 / ATCC 24843) TaxID=284812 RepID=VPS3_SCHPO|nr:putative GTPase regulator Vps3 [Schizosaccharomyces pombe]O59796.2 RecName: Full=Vacuolar protein sorting-associated protein 3 [Schizosaccharomyces pombe 972h-]CAA18287.1 GTPase regulator Vps3 (predicted) [Schizosaccharomyces pombe]|eukprot:NP_587839.1 putative GTPase regulator Vps3 [Schizosaccharomyces pombe]
MSDIELHESAIPKELDSPVTTIALYNNHLYFGTEGGDVFLYNFSNFQLNESPELVKKISLVSKSRVNRILAMPFLGAVFIHHGSFAEVYKEDDLTQLYPSISFKGLVEFCHPGQRIDEKSTYLIVTNTHLKLISFQKDGIILVKNELKYPNIQTARVNGHIVCLVTENSFELLDILTFDTTPLFPIIKYDSENNGLMYKPMIVLHSNEFLLITGSPKDAIGLFVDSQGNVTRSTLTFSFYPKHVFSTSHYVFAISSSSLQIIDINTLSLVKSINLKDDESFSFISRLTSVHFCDRQIFSKFSAVNTASTSKTSDTIERASFSKPSFIFLTNKSWGFGAEAHFMNKLEFSITIGDIEAPLRRVSKRLRNPKKYGITNDVAYLQSAYLEQISALQYWKQGQYENSLSLLETSKIDPRVVISLYPDLYHSELSYIAFQGVISFRKSILSVDDTVANVLKSNELFRDTDQYTQRQMIEITKENAYIMLMRYLKNYKKNTSISEYLLSSQRDVMLAVEHSLLLLYLNMDDLAAGTKNAKELLESGLTGVEDIKDVLIQKKEYYLLSVLLATVRDHDGVLQTWKKLITGDYEDRRFNDGLIKIREYLVNDIEPSTFWEFTTWLCKHDATEGTRVLLDKTVSGSISAEDVLEHLDSSQDDVLIDYLVKSNSVTHRALLLKLCVNKLLGSLLDHNDFKNRLETAIETFRELPCMEKPTYAQYLEQLWGDMSDFSTHLSFYYLCSINLMENVEEESIDKIKDILFDIHVDNLYLFPQLEHSFYKRKKNYEKALSVLVTNIHDYKGGEAYCLQIDDVYPQCWCNLLEKCISTGDGCSDFIKELLYRRPFSYTLSYVCEQIPDHWNLNLLADFLCILQKRNAERLNESQTRLTLEKSLSQNLEELFMAINRRNVALGKNEI